MTFSKAGLCCALLSLLAAFQASAQSLVGAWTIGSTTVEGASVVVFFGNGYYFQIQNAQASEAPHGFDGFERGTYTWNPATGAFTVTTIQDLNGDTGFSTLTGVSGITVTVSGDVATANIPGPDGGTALLNRVTGASPIVGAWSFGNPAAANDSGVVVFLPNGVYFEAEDGDSSPVSGDPNGQDGIEHGTYAWNPATGLLTSSRAPPPYVDTNGEWGLSHTGTQLTFLLSADGLTLNGTTGPGDSFSLARVGATAATIPDLNQHGLTGSWYEPATSGQGLAVQIIPDQSPGNGLAFVSWFTFDTVSGGPERQRWYTLQGPVVTGQPSAALTIYRNTGGNFNAPPATSAQAVGTATLSFATCTSGELSYSFSDGSGRSGTVPLTRLLPNVTCSVTTPHPTNADYALSGSWYGGDATSGQGFTAEVAPNSGAFFLSWFTYMPNGASAGAEGQRWYTAQGAFTPGLRTIPVQIYATTGGVFDTATPPGPGTAQVGTGTMSFQSCSAATMSYSFTGGSSVGLSGTIALGRVGPVPPGCTQ